MYNCVACIAVLPIKDGEIGVVRASDTTLDTTIIQVSDQ